MSFINLRTSESREDVSRWFIAALLYFHYQYIHPFADANIAKKASTTNI